MAKSPPRPLKEDPREAGLSQSMEQFFDATWYRTRYPDVIAAGHEPLRHFIRYGLAEQRDPNPFFDSAWYTEHYPDVSAGGMHPLLHYMQAGSWELRNPHPNFDAAWYAGQHPQAAANPLLYHVATGKSLGFPTEKPVDIRDYLPSGHKPAPLPRNVVVDVVIPVYRGLAETRRCIASVLADTGKPLGRIIVVDDRSPEPELSAWLRELAGAHRIHLVRNPRNVGFVASVNRGMRESGTHDVVLLNSDTEVPAGWLGRLAARAYAEPRIASVSPFSNNATICGYPATEGGPIAFGQTLTDIDETCRTINAGRWVDVPTTVGFCMYIRRAALDQVGDFDADRFTLGYGEENDFCLRASALGWHHRLACDTFVYHQGSVSFGDRANKLAQRAIKLILERHPTYLADIARHVDLGSVDPFRFAVTAALFRQSELPVILMVAHELGGGVRRHIDSLVTRFRDQARFLLLRATDRGAALSVLSLPHHPTLALSKERLDDLAVLLRSMNVSRVHIHHLLGMDMDIRTLIRRLDVPFDVTVHDYYAICPQINLLPWRHSLYCGEPDIAGCNACIAHRGSNRAREIVTWRAERAWQFKEAARVFCPSLDVLSRLQRHGLADNAILAPHEAVQAGPWKLRNVPPGDGKLKIAVIGTLVNHKGARTVASVAEMADPETMEIYLIGHTDGPFSERAAELMTITGKYDDADLPDLIETIAPHLIWFPAVWPETFSYTLSAAIDAGIPIAATRIGAHTERLAGRPFTWLADIATPPLGWLDLFDEIRAALLESAPAAGSPARAAVEDAYATDYLHAPARPRPARVRRERSKPHIVVMPERFEIGTPTPCAYIRLLQPLHHPAIAGGFDVHVATPETIFDEDADIIVTQRFAIPDIATADRLAAHARRTGARLVYDLDDDLLNIPRTHPDAKVLRPHAKVVRRMVETADTVWVSTHGLAERLAAIRTDAEVIPNGLDERIWVPPAPSLQDHPVRILCMGTATHDDDFAMIEPALVRLKAEYDHRVTITIVGITMRNDLPPGLNRLGMPRSATRSYPGFVNWLRAVEPPWHIGLAPLLDTPFNLCKSPIKAMDYAALGLAVLASDTPVYRGSIADGPAGQLVPNTSAAWYAALNWLLRNRNERQAVAAGSHDAFLARNTLASQAEIRRAALTRLTTVRTTNEAA
ncbi:glycosyltransferase [Acidisphaera sp. S103]|uniref:glycosyltransferase n=1 Tax=Acidisphaera sp. S103 TaxID=1747223 RepID=UPI00131CF451|nr:glycosyltransferase [Acidisphaera sp. S103]